MQQLRDGDRVVVEFVRGKGDRVSPSEGQEVLETLHGLQAVGKYTKPDKGKGTCIPGVTIPADWVFRALRQRAPSLCDWCCSGPCWQTFAGCLNFFIPISNVLVIRLVERVGCSSVIVAKHLSGRRSPTPRAA